MYPSTNNLANSSYTPPPPDSSTNPNFSSFFHPIHSPYLFFEEDLHHIHEYFLHQQQQAHTTNVAHAHDQEITTAMENHLELEAEAAVNRGIVLVKDDALCNNSNSTNGKQIPRKRTSKKDRHSKINTAHGPRDRRMRLSLDVAQKFFGLQDILGFDKASKTVHWLLTKSKTAIKQLTNSKPGGNNNVSNTASVSSTSNTSECEVLSGIINDDSSLSLPGGEVTTTEKEKVKPAVVPREKRAATSSKASRGTRAFHPLAKETRERARARARERTVEKRIRLGNNVMEGMDQTLNRHLRSWSPFEASGGEESSTQIQIVNDHPSFLRAVHQQQASQSGTSLHKQGINVGGHEHSLFNAPVSWSASPYSNYHHNAAISSHENQFMEFQCFGKPWDQVYNN